MLKTGISRNFNDCYIIIKAKCIITVKKNHTKKLTFVDITNNMKKKYI